MGKKTAFCFKRFEKKYLLTESCYSTLIKELAPYVKEDSYFRSQICNVYYDTENWQLIRKSIEKPYYKAKLRVRSYGVPKNGDKIFAELKKKCGGIVYKRRAAVSAKSIADGTFDKELADGGQIEKEILWFKNFYKAFPRVFIAYDRLSYIGRFDNGLRITFDSNIRYRLDRLDLTCGDDGTLLDTGGVLMEIKTLGGCPLWLCEILSKNKILPTSFSKYGTVYKKLLKKEGAFKCLAQ